MRGAGRRAGGSRTSSMQRIPHCWVRVACRCVDSICLYQCKSGVVPIDDLVIKGVPQRSRSPRTEESVSHKAVYSDRLLIGS
jgi:hypothetical protein